MSLKLRLIKNIIYIRKLHSDKQKFKLLYYILNIYENHKQYQEEEVKYLSIHKLNKVNRDIDYIRDNILYRFIKLYSDLKIPFIKIKQGKIQIEYLKG